jgi:N-methylhydantoinase A
MQSNGGVMTAEAAIEKPAHIVESGAAAGVIASAYVAERAGYANVITLDMGGTTSKSSMIENGMVTKTSEYEAGAGINLSSRLVKGGGHALKLPLIDLSEIGAGGGSIVWINKGGLIQVGPRSAGALPGPACYDRGGDEPTLTDAHVVLGYLNPQHLAGGQVRLNAGKARELLQRKVAGPLRMTAVDTAYGIHTIASATMMRAVKAISTYRGRDPRDFVLMAFGGNGPICGVEMARFLQMKRVIVPRFPGLFSAFGLLLSKIEHQFVRTWMRKTRDLSVHELNDLYSDLDRQARSALAQEGCAPDEMSVERYADLRYSGQAYELTVPVPGGQILSSHILEIVRAFELEHLQTYGHRATEEPVDLVNLRAVARSAINREWLPNAFALKRAGEARHLPISSKRDAYFGPEHGLLSTPVVARDDLAPRAMQGPLIVEELDATCVIPPGCEASLDDWSNIVIDIRVDAN